MDKRRCHQDAPLLALWLCPGDTEGVWILEGFWLWDDMSIQI